MRTAVVFLIVFALALLALWIARVYEQRQMVASLAGDGAIARHLSIRDPFDLARQVDGIELIGIKVGGQVVGYRSDMAVEQTALAASEVLSRQGWQQTSSANGLSTYQRTADTSDLHGTYLLVQCLPTANGCSLVLQLG